MTLIYNTVNNVKGTEGRYGDTRLGISLFLSSLKSEVIYIVLNILNSVDGV
jgi:hypothetical protein